MYWWRFLNLLNPHAPNHRSRESNRFDTGRLEEGVLRVIEPFKELHLPGVLSCVRLHDLLNPFRFVKTSSGSSFGLLGILVQQSNTPLHISKSLPIGRFPRIAAKQNAVFTALN